MNKQSARDALIGIGIGAAVAMTVATADAAIVSEYDGFRISTYVDGEILCEPKSEYSGGWDEFALRIGLNHQLEMLSIQHTSLGPVNAVAFGDGPDFDTSTILLIAATTEDGRVCVIGTAERVAPGDPA